MASLPKILTDETSVLHERCAHSPLELVYKESLKPNYYGFQLCHTAPHSASTMDRELYCGKYESFTVQYELTLLKYESTVKPDTLYVPHARAVERFCCSLYTNVDVHCI